MAWKSESGNDGEGKYFRSYSPRGNVKEKAGRDRRIRVALTITEMNVGGAERCAANLALGLDHSRFEPEVVSLGPRPVGEQAALVERLEAAGVPLHFLDLPSARQFWQGLKRLEQHFRQQRPDLVQTFLFHANVLGAIAAGRAEAPSLATSVRVADPRRRRLWIERLATRKADRIVCVSRSVAEFVTRRGGFPADKVEVIPNGIDLAVYERAAPAELRKYGLPDGQRAIAVVGRLDPQKGVDWLLAMAPQILSAAQHHDVLIVGDGPERRELESAAQKSGLADRIHFVGWRSNVPQILASCDLLLLPSRWEGMPNVVLEAMASRLSVVATLSEGVAELLGPNAEPQTAAFGDSQAFIDKAIKFCSDREFAIATGKENRIRAEQSFSLTAMISEYQALYERLTGICG
jgi:glycosyltransferase involved in cell wall biosynthesis